MTADIIPFPTRKSSVDPLQEYFARMEAWKNRPWEPQALREWMQQHYPDSDQEFDW